jgi:hypothetical protein
MLYQCYLRKGIVYVPSVAKIVTGGYKDIDPIAVAAVADAEGVRRGLREAMARGNPVVPSQRGSEWPPPAILKYAKVKNWSRVRPRDVVLADQRKRWDISNRRPAKGAGWRLGGRSGEDRHSPARLDRPRTRSSA